MEKKVGNREQIAYVRRYTLTDGAKAGLKIAEVDNGKLRFLLNESKALDITQLWHRGMNVSFLSKNGLVSRDLPFSRRFEGGMLYTCGLDSVGAREGFELHGTLHNTPAEIFRIDCDEEKITVCAGTEDTELFGKNLVLFRTVETAVGSDTVTVTDTLENRGNREEDYCILNHVNLGYPFLDEGVTIEGDEAEARPRTAWAKERIGDRLLFGGAKDCEEERCYFIRHNVPSVKAVNKRIGKSFRLGYSQETLPCFVQWSSAASGDYALGLEPSSTYLDDEFRYRKIKPRERVVFRLTLTVKDI